MEEYVFKYLNKRYKIKRSVVKIIDNDPREHLRRMFGDDAPMFYYRWLWSLPQHKIYELHYPNGLKEWRKAGFLHSKGDSPAKIYPDGKKEWWRQDKLHRTKGPAVVNKLLEWWIDGKRHREDGPAVTIIDRHRWDYSDKDCPYDQYFLNGREICKEEFYLRKT